MLLGSVLDATVVQVAVEACLVDGIHGAQTHGDSRELPKFRHAVRVRVGRQTVVRLGGLLAEGIQVFFGKAAFQESAGVHAGGGVALEEDLVAAAWVILAAEEVVQADLVERGRGGVGGDVAAHPDTWALGAVDHDGRVPADPAAVALLDLLVAREVGLLGGGDGVDVVGGQQGRKGDALGGGAFQQAQHQVAAAVRAGGFQQPVEGIHPLLGFLRVGIGQVGGHSVSDQSKVAGIVCAVVLFCRSGHWFVLLRSAGCGAPVV